MGKGKRCSRAGVSLRGLVKKGGGNTVPGPGKKNRKQLKERLLAVPTNRRETKHLQKERGRNFSPIVAWYKDNEAFRTKYKVRKNTRRVGPC